MSTYRHARTQAPRRRTSPAKYKMPLRVLSPLCGNMVDREVASEPTQIHQRPSDLYFAFEQGRSSIGPKDNGPKGNFHDLTHADYDFTPIRSTPRCSVMVAGATLELGRRLSLS